MKLKTLKIAVLSAIAATSFSAFSSEIGYQDNGIDFNTLSNLEYSEDYEGSDLVTGKLDSSEVRLREVRNTALALGAQHGYIFYMNEFKRAIEDKSTYFDKNFDFNTIMKLASSEMSELHFLPPVITKMNSRVYVTDNATSATFIQDEYSIDRTGMIVSVAPNWRQYLLFDEFVEVTKPNVNLLPKDSSEKRKWQGWVREGWLAGYKQADLEMTYRARKLGRDFKGMVQYMLLVNKGMINKPLIVSSSQNATGSDKLMRINEKTIKIAIPAKLNHDEDNWKALIMDDRGSLRTPDERSLILTRSKE